MIDEGRETSIAGRGLDFQWFDLALEEVAARMAAEKSPSNHGVRIVQIF